MPVCRGYSSSDIYVVDSTVTSTATYVILSRDDHAAVTTDNIEVVRQLLRLGQGLTEPDPKAYIPEPTPTSFVKQIYQDNRREAARLYLQQVAKAERHRPEKGKFRKVSRRKIRR